MIILGTISKPKDMIYPPLGLLYLGNALKREGYDVKVIHYPSDKIDELARKIVKKNPLFVGINSITGKQTKFSADLSKKIKELSDVPIVWGGIHTTLMPEQCLSEDYVDYVVKGEGEETIVELASALEGKKELSLVKGIGYKSNGKLFFTKDRPFIKNIDKYKTDWSLLNIKDYITNLWDCKRVITFTTSRGCPFNCSFCYNLVFNKRRWRGHTAEYVIKEVEYLKDNYNIDGIIFQDDNFFVDKKRALDILKGVKLPWSAELRVDYITKNLAQKFRETQCRQVLFGLESGSNRILKLIRKGYTVEDSKRGIKILKEFPEIKIMVSFIFGLPTETKDELNKTIDLGLYLANIHPRVIFTTGVYLPYPGTDMYDLAIKMGFEPPSNTEGWGKFDRWRDELDLPWLTNDEIHKFMLIRNYFHYIIFRNLNIPIINRFSYYRLSKKNFSFPLELFLLNPLKDKFSDRNSFLNHIVNRLSYFVATKQFRNTFPKKNRDCN